MTAVTRRESTTENNNCTSTAEDANIINGVRSVIKAKAKGFKSRRFSQRARFPLRIILFSRLFPTPRANHVRFPPPRCLYIEHYHYRNSEHRYTDITAMQLE